LGSKEERENRRKEGLGSKMKRGNIEKRIEKKVAKRVSAEAVKMPCAEAWGASLPSMSCNP